MIRTLNNVHKSDVIALHRKGNVVVHGIPEPYIKIDKWRKSMVRHQVMHLLRTVGILVHVTVKRVLRLGKWKEYNDSWRFRAHRFEPPENHQPKLRPTQIFNAIGTRSRTDIGQVRQFAA